MQYKESSSSFCACPASPPATEPAGRDHLLKPMMRPRQMIRRAQRKLEGVRNAFRKQAGWAKLQEARAAAAKHWTERVWYRHNQRWLQASREGTEASKSGSFKDEREWGKKCFEDLDQRRMGRPVTRTWSTDFLLREGSSREDIGKWLKNKSIPWQRRRRVLQVVTGTFPCGQQMVKYGYKDKAECTLCRTAHEESGSSWNRELPKATIGHIQSAGCLGKKRDSHGSTQCVHPRVAAGN